MYRKIEEKIEKWIHSSRNALLITGARQVGKTYIIRNTLKNENCHLLNLIF